MVKKKKIKLKNKRPELRLPGQKPKFFPGKLKKNFARAPP